MVSRPQVKTGMVTGAMRMANSPKCTRLFTDDEVLGVRRPVDAQGVPMAACIIRLRGSSKLVQMLAGELVDLFVIMMQIPDSSREATLW